jgi:hypothetical protein
MNKKKVQEEPEQEAEDSNYLQERSHLSGDQEIEFQEIEFQEIETGD